MLGSMTWNKMWILTVLNSVVIVEVVNLFLLDRSNGVMVKKLFTGIE